MIKQIFTWWNSQTVGTFIYTIFFGKSIGKDQHFLKVELNEKINEGSIISCIYTGIQNDTLLAKKI